MNDSPVGCQSRAVTEPAGESVAAVLLPSPVGEGVSRRLTDEALHSGFHLDVKLLFCFSYSSSTADAVPLLPQEKANQITDGTLG